VQDIPKIFRITVQVSNLAEAVRFYSALLGIEGRPIRGGRHYFDCGSIILALIAPEGGAQPNPDDIYFSVKDLDAIHARAEKLGCLAKSEVHDEPAGNIVVRPWGERSFYVADPSGNELCFVDTSTIFTGNR
jgi:catechol 2,3-dioxygenase-like lactoylglutathione lyase family enzyme